MSSSTAPPSPPNPVAENSDDSLLVNELSFDYVVDETGKPVRLTKPRSTKSISPPRHSTDAAEPAALRRNNSLSSSESAFPANDPSAPLMPGPSSAASRPFLRSNSGPIAPSSAPRRVSADKSAAIPRRAELDLRAERDQLLAALPEEKENAATYIDSDVDYDKFAKSARRTSPPRGQPISRTSSQNNVVNPPLPQRRTARQYEWGAASKTSEGETTDPDEEDLQTAQNKAPLGRSGNTRPRRSASFSDALATEEGHNAVPSASRSSAGHRPVSSLGINGLNGYELSSEQARPRTSLGLSNEDDGKMAAHRKRIDEGANSPSSPHSQSQAKPRPGYGHRRRDSDTLRSANSHGNLIAANSPTAVEVPGRQSPAGRVPLSQMSQKRSPAAPEAPAKGAVALKQQASKVWSGEDGEDRGRSKAAAPPPPQAQVQQQPMYMMPVAQARHIVVNKHTYTRLDLIGKGGSSRVYRVLNASNEVFAIKRVSLDKIDQETMQGYLNEIQLLKRLNGNARIIRLQESELKTTGSSKGTLLLVMECGEIDFARLLAEQAKQPLNMVWVAYYWQQMLQAVQVVHDEKIVHSDLKPANFVLVKGQLKLIDFGIANAIANDTTNIQRDHQIGTVNYMSPEAIELPEGMRRLKVGRPSDVWSLGCILYQMIYGLPPFHHLGVYAKMKAIPDPSYTIEFHEFSAPADSSAKTSGNGNTPPKRMSHLKKRVRKDAIETMKKCLTRAPKERATIPELLAEAWIELKEEEQNTSSSSPPPSSSRPALGKDEVIMNPHYMRQLLEYAKNLPSNVSDEFLESDAKRLVQELKRVSGPQ